MKLHFCSLKILNKTNTNLNRRNQSKTKQKVVKVKLINSLTLQKTIIISIISAHYSKTKHKMNK